MILLEYVGLLSLGRQPVLRKVVWRKAEKACPGPPWHTLVRWPAKLILHFQWYTDSKIRRLGAKWQQMCGSVSFLTNKSNWAVFKSLARKGEYPNVKAMSAFTSLVRANALKLQFYQRSWSVLFTSTSWESKKHLTYLIYSVNTY